MHEGIKHAGKEPDSILLASLFNDLDVLFIDGIRPHDETFRELGQEFYEELGGEGGGA